MKSVGTVFSGILVVGCGLAPARAAEPKADKGKEAAVAFAEALKGRDLDAAMKLVGSPFPLEKKGKAPGVRKVEEVRAELKRLFDHIDDPDKIPTKVREVVPAAKLRERFEEKVIGLDRIEKALGRDGYMVIFAEEKTEEGMVVLVRLRDGTAKVVGLVD